MKDWLQNDALILMEAAVAERVSRLPGVRMHPELFHTPLIYAPESAAVLADIYREYMHIARSAGVPLLLAAPTWRLDLDRVARAEVPSTINTDAVRFLTELVRSESPMRVRVGGLLGPRGDCYQPEVALPAEAAEVFHQPQAEELAAAGVAYLLGQTLPAVSEAMGMARALRATGVPSIISFCIQPDGRVLDGAPLNQAIREVDDATGGALLGYMVNCSYPTFLNPEDLSPASRSRLIGFDANASSRVPWELEGSASSAAEPVAAWADAMLELHRSCGLPILGGCCGTTGDHLRALVNRS